MPDGEIPTTILNEPRLVVRKFLARPQHEGLGAIVRRSIGRYIIYNCDAEKLMILSWLYD